MSGGFEGLRKNKELWRIGVLLALAVLVYGNTFRNWFVFDDEVYIFRNHVVTNPSVQGLITPTKANNVFRPVYFASLALDWKLGGGKPLTYHLVNVLLHALVTLLLYLTLRKLLEGVREGPTIAFVTALLFAVHPIHTEAVAWASARSELLAAGFLLGAWLLHLQDWPILSLACFILALLSKESAMAFLPLAFIGDCLRNQFKAVRVYVSMTIVAMAYVPLLWIVQGGRLGEKSINFADNPLYALPAMWRILNALRIAWKYVGLQVYPGTLSCDYSYNAIRLYMNWWRTVPVAAVTAAVFAIWLWAVWKRKAGWALAGAIYFAGFAVTANVLLPTGTIMGERLAYLPSAGFCLLIALLWTQWQSRRKELAWALLIVVAVALGARTWVRNRDWHDNLTLFTRAVRAVPESTKMRGNAGGAYMYMGRLPEAQRELSIALRIYPDIPENAGFYGLVESKLGHDEEALKQMERAVRITNRSNVNYDFLALNLASQLVKMGRDQEALQLLNREIVECPECARAWSNRAVIRYRNGELSGARTDAEAALRLDPRNEQAQELLSALNKAAAPVKPS